MNLYFRLLLLLIRAYFRPRCPALGPCVTRFRVMPSDLDLMGHMNNGKYLSILDLARADLVIRSGVSTCLRREGLYPVVGTEMIQFKKSLRLFDAFEVETRVLGWDSKFFLVEHRFVNEGRVVATAMVWTCFVRASGGTASSREVLDAAGYAGAEPSYPEWGHAWAQLRKSVWPQQVGSAEENPESILP